MIMDINSTFEYFRAKGGGAITKHYLRYGARSGQLPHIKNGNRYLFCIEVLEEYFKKASIENVVNNNICKYGTIRKISE